MTDRNSLFEFGVPDSPIPDTKTETVLIHGGTLTAVHNQLLLFFLLDGAI